MHQPSVRMLTSVPGITKTPSTPNKSSSFFGSAIGGLLGVFIVTCMLSGIAIVIAWAYSIIRSLLIGG